MAGQDNSQGKPPPGGSGIPRIAPAAPTRPGQPAAPGQTGSRLPVVTPAQVAPVPAGPRLPQLTPHHGVPVLAKLPQVTPQAGTPRPPGAPTGQTGPRLPVAAPVGATGQTGQRPPVAPPVISGPRPPSGSASVVRPPPAGPPVMAPQAVRTPAQPSGARPGVAPPMVPTASPSMVARVTQGPVAPIPSGTNSGRAAIAMGPGPSVASPPAGVPISSPSIASAPSNAAPALHNTLAATPSGAPQRPSPLPATGAVEKITPQQAAQLKTITQSLDSMDYFQVLQLPQGAALADIKRSFYKESRVYHPDRFFHIADAAAKENIGHIYKRITEAYYVLRDEVKRKKYLLDINGPERAGKLRYTEASDAELKAEVKKQKDEQIGVHPKARQFYATALKDFDSGNFQAAERNLKTAITYEPSNARYKEKLVEVQRKLEDARKAGSSFMIK